MKILVFTEGTVLMHCAAVGVARETRVQQVVAGERSVDDFSTYVPNADSVKKIKCWVSNGAEIYYLTSRRLDNEIQMIRNILQKYGFPSVENLRYRIGSEDYKDVAIRVAPDIIIEDDCESIGGEKEMIFPHLPENFKRKIKSVVVKEFDGIDALPEEFV